jgi:phosphoglucosamine mutase
MQIVAKSKKSLLDLATTMKKYPQILINIENVKKEKLASSEKINSAILKAEKELAANGRVLVRASGTEPLVRVMVEADDLNIAQSIADSLAQLVKSELQ